jgi:phage terminase large subunit-like protein
MMPLIQATERVIIGNRLHHGGHEVLTWNFMNVEVETNKAGHKVRLCKQAKDSPLVIDGAVATTIAVGRASAGESNKSVYANTEERPEGLLVW